MNTCLPHIHTHPTNPHLNTLTLWNLSHPLIHTPDTLTMTSCHPRHSHKVKGWTVSWPIHALWPTPLQSELNESLGVILGYSRSIVEEKKNPYMENLLSQEVEGWRLVLKGEKWQIWLVCFLRILFLFFTQKLWNSAGFNMLERSFVSFMDWNERDDFATMLWVKINSAAQKKHDWRMSSVWHWKYKHDSEQQHLRAEWDSH